MKPKQYNWSKVLFLHEDLETMTYRAWKNMIYCQAMVLRGSMAVKGIRFQEMAEEDKEREKTAMRQLIEEAEEQLGKDVVAEMLLQMEED